MTDETRPERVTRKRIPLVLELQDYEELVRRAAANDRFDWQEAKRIVTDALRKKQP
jgi:hypothetical protein